MSDLSFLRVATMLVARDLTESVTIYRESLQFEVVEQSEWIVLLRQGTTLFYLFSQSPLTSDKSDITLESLSTPEHTCVILVFQVADCWATYRALSAKGAVFLTEPCKKACGETERKEFEHEGKKASRAWEDDATVAGTIRAFRKECAAAQ